ATRDVASPAQDRLLVGVFAAHLPYGAGPAPAADRRAGGDWSDVGEFVGDGGVAGGALPPVRVDGGHAALTCGNWITLVLCRRLLSGSRHRVQPWSPGS